MNKTRRERRKMGVMVFCAKADPRSQTVQINVRLRGIAAGS